MHLAQTKEREYRFKLALRIGLPIFALLLTLVSHTLITTYQNLTSLFYFESALLLGFSIYFIFYLIYNSFDERITESVTKVFTRDYLYAYLEREIKKNNIVSFALFSVDNINEINEQYGIKNGDRVLESFVIWIYDFFNSNGITQFPMGHLKSGDFMIGLPKEKLEYLVLFELLCLKSENFRVDDIEIKISGAINDINFSKNLEYIVENLFEIQKEHRETRNTEQESFEINPNELELFVIESIKSREIQLSLQDVYKDNTVQFQECFVKLGNNETKIIHQKSYMKVLNKLGLTIEFDLLVCEKIYELLCKDSRAKIAITVSPATLRNYKFKEKIENIFINMAFCKERVIFILSEEHYFAPIAKFETVIQFLRKEGFLIAIDRIGAYHSSFLYVRDLEVDFMRIDSYYSKNLQNSNNIAAINAFKAFAKSKNIATWMKLIEDKEMKESACELGIEYLQGRYLSDIKILNKG